MKDGDNELWRESLPSFPKDERDEMRLDYLIRQSKGSKECPCGDLTREEERELHRLQELLGRNEERNYHEKHAYARHMAQSENPELWKG